MTMIAVAGHSAAFELVTDGRPVATVVLPVEANESETYAAGMLARHVRSGSGAQLEIVTDAQATDGPVISIGRTKMALAQGIRADDLAGDGYRVLVKDGVLYCVGRDAARHYNPWNDEDRRIIAKNGRLKSYMLGAKGTIRSAMRLLEELGVRWLQPTPTGTYVPDLKNAAVADDLDISYEPHVLYAGGRIDSFGEWSLANNFRTAMRNYSGGGHTWDHFVPAELWDEHPEYFRMKSGERPKPGARNRMLCPSNPDVIKLLADGVRKKFDAGFDLVQLAQSDGYRPCECGPCRALDEPGEHHEQVHLAHYQVMLDVYKTHPDKKVNLLIYGPTDTPSAMIERYPPNGVVELSGARDENNLRYWSQKMPGGLTAYVYYMGNYHAEGQAPQFTPKMASEELRKLRRYNVFGIYYCGGGENWGAEGPTYYALGRLMGNPDLDWRRLLDEYCTLTFGDAAATMMEYYLLLYDRIDRVGSASLTGPQVFCATFPPHELEQFEKLLATAKSLAQGNERAANWVRLAEFMHRHYALIAGVYHLHHAYESNRTIENLKQTQVAVVDWTAYCDEFEALPETDREFVNHYFYEYGRWKRVRSNFGHLQSPFGWDFDKLIAENYLPGKTRRRTVISRLTAAPEIDGRADDPAWENVAWETINEISLGPVKAPTRLRTGYDDANIYVAFECEEPMWQHLTLKPAARDDAAVYAAECVEIFFSPDGLGKKVMHFIAAPSDGAIYDGRVGYIDDPYHPLVLTGAEDTSWNPDYRVAFRKDDQAKTWTMEVAIPFASLGVDTPAEGQVWMGNFGRERFTENYAPGGTGREWDLYLWSPNLQGMSFTDPSTFGEFYFGSVPDNN
jgi:hypothetical protein